MPREDGRWFGWTDMAESRWRKCTVEWTDEQKGKGNLANGRSHLNGQAGLWNSLQQGPTLANSIHFKESQDKVALGHDSQMCKPTSWSRMLHISRYYG